MIDVPESVLTYFGQQSVRTAVDLLLAHREPRVPGNLKWNEVSDWYRATLAARQVAADFAIFTSELWTAVWSDVPGGWKADAPDDPDRDDLSIAISAVWDEGCFSRRFTREGWSLELAAGYWTDRGFQLGVGVYDKRDSEKLRGRLPDGWSREGGDMYWTQEDITPLSPTVSPEPFRQWTEGAWRAVAAAIGGI